MWSGYKTDMLYSRRRLPSLAYLDLVRFLYRALWLTVAPRALIGEAGNAGGFLTRNYEDSAAGGDSVKVVVLNAPNGEEGLWNDASSRPS